MVHHEESRPFPFALGPAASPASESLKSESATPATPKVGAIRPGDEVEAKPTRSADAVGNPVADPWAGLAVDANELLGRMHAGQGWDPQHVIQRALAERRAA